MTEPLVSGGPERSRPERSWWRPLIKPLVLLAVSIATILLLAIRFTGIGADLLPLLLVLGTFCTAYPLTVMPLFDFGVLDAALLAAFTEVAGLEHEATIVEALAVWGASPCSARWCSA